MIRLRTEIDGEPHLLQLRSEGRTVAVDVDGRAYTLEVHNPSEGEYLLRNENHIYHCRVEKRGARREALVVNLRGMSFAIQLKDPKRSPVKSSGGHDHGSAQIIAPMPGKVVRLLVDIGSQVEAGAGIMVVEAMKMQNEMKSPKAGLVISLNAVAGATVNAGDVLAEVE